MPLYEYACAACAHRFEIRQGIRDASLTTCPECGGAIRRVTFPVGIVFKGSGFYKTDSRSAPQGTIPAGEKKTETAETTGEPAPAKSNGDTPTPAPTPAAASASPAAPGPVAAASK